MSVMLTSVFLFICVEGFVTLEFCYL